MRTTKRDSFTHWFSPQMATTAEVGPGGSQEPCTASRSVWGLRLEYLGHDPLQTH